MFYPPRPSQRLAQRPFNLGIEAAQIIVGPTLHGVEQLGINPQGEGFFAHGSPRIKRASAGTSSGANGKPGSL